MFRKPVNNSYRKNLKEKTKLIGSGSGKTTTKTEIPEPATPSTNTTIEFAEIKQYLTGFARCVIYKQGNIEGQNKFFISLNEGQFENGIIKGYGRVIDNKGECKAGFWNTLNIDHKGDKGKKKSLTPGLSSDIVSVPSGKWCWFDKAGKFKVAESLYICK